MRFKKENLEKDILYILMSLKSKWEEFAGRTDSGKLVNIYRERRATWPKIVRLENY